MANNGYYISVMSFFNNVCGPVSYICLYSKRERAVMSIAVIKIDGNDDGDDGGAGTS